MTGLHFVKMSGAGNDFIFVEPAELEYPALARKACARGRSLGADGLVVATREPPFEISIYNPDGTRAEMCGNAGICYARLAHERFAATQAFEFKAAGNAISARVDGERAAIRLEDLSSIERLTVDGQPYFYVEVDGVPHAICFSEPLFHLSRAEFEDFGRRVRHHRAFKKGANVSTLRRIRDTEFALRTYERGVEAETLGCGTGAAAAARVAWDLYGFSRVSMASAGGMIDVLPVPNSDGTEAWIEGNAELVADGIVYVNTTNRSGV